MTDLKNIDPIQSEAINSEKGNSEKGASMVEYALLVALIAIVALVAVQRVGTNASLKFSQVAESIAQAGNN